jgi:hypothetical protein
MFSLTSAVNRSSRKSCAVMRNFLWFAALLCAAALVFSGCPLEDDEDDLPEGFNPELIGTWEASGDGWSDTYVIKSDGGRVTIAHGDNEPDEIVYAYNFNPDSTAGCLITQRPSDDKYTAVYFQLLVPGTEVVLGSAWDTTIPYPGNNDPAVATLEEAKERFAPENAEAYGGGTAQYISIFSKIK